MNIGQAKEEIENTIKAYTAKDADGNYKIPPVHQRPVLLMGPPGIGKTAIMKQIAKEMGIGLVEYTLTHHTRQSAVGLPVLSKKIFEGREHTVTEYTMSEIVASVYECMEETGVKEGILFLDEINCVSETLAPTMLQFLQQKTFGTHKLPKGWLIVAAGNPSQYNKTARDFDIVTLDRVKKIEVEEDYPVWRQYAVKHGVHPSIWAYLDIRKDRFYKVEDDREGVSFVTARGWEDLSRMLLEYEELKIPVSRELISQYLQEKETAGEFSDFYALCATYQEEYEPEKILEKDAGENQEASRLYAQAGFEERIAVLSFLEAALQTRAREYRREERYDSFLHQELAKLKEIVKQEPENREFDRILEDFVQELKQKQKVLKEQRLLEAERAAWMERLDRWLGKELLEVRKNRILNKQQGFEQVKQDFYRETVRLKKKSEELELALKRGICFATENPGAGQEAALFLTRISEDPDIMGFIGEYGCDIYLEKGECLLRSQREETLKQEIRRFYEQEERERMEKIESYT